MHLLHREVQRLQLRMDTKPVLGELLHPPPEDTAFFSSSAAHASHQVVLAEGFNYIITTTRFGCVDALAILEAVLSSPQKKPPGIASAAAGQCLSLSLVQCCQQ